MSFNIKNRVFGIFLLISMIINIQFVVGIGLTADNNQEIDFSEFNVALYKSSIPWEIDITAFSYLIPWIGCNLTLVESDDVKAGVLNNMDIIIFPGGNNIYWSDLGIEGRDIIRDFINNGGGYMGFCAGAFYACFSTVWYPFEGADPLPEDKDEFLDLFDGVGTGPIYEISEFPGSAMTQIDIENQEHMITHSLPESMTIYYEGGPYLEPNINADVTILGIFNEINKPAMLCFEYGNGKVFISGPHPEFEEDSDRDGLAPWVDMSDVESDWELLKQVVQWLVSPESNSSGIGIPLYSLVFPLALIVCFLIIRVKKQIIGNQTC
ncbi:MAG: hypothetical protein JXA99_08950 [Candidatus Lokiarchaeota archaeon]|nr:hypothetical protein [Candidatus Lokiarchaeota archaeon]